MKRLLAIMVLSMLIIIAFSGCGNGETTPEATPAPTPETVADNNQGNETPPADDPEPAGRWPEYIELGRGWPVVREGMGDDIVLTMAVHQPGTGADWEDMWLFEFYREFLGIQFEVEQILAPAREERITLMFAADELPDILMNLAISPARLFRFGQLEGQLLDLGPYIDADLTPFMYETFNARPDARQVATTPDGAMYSLPNVIPLDAEQFPPRIFVDSRWLEATDLDMPSTLDEFVDMLFAFQDADPNNVGNANVISLGGAHNWGAPHWFILNALGIITGGGHADALFAPALINGEATIPAADPVRFLEFLTIMNRLYEGGILDPDYFVGLDSVGMQNRLLDRRVGVFGDTLFGHGYEDWRYWDAIPPLTSESGPTRIWRSPPVANVGGFAMSSRTNHAALGMAFADLYFSEYGVFMWHGPPRDDSDFYKMDPVRWPGPAMYWNEELQDVLNDVTAWAPGVDGLWGALLGNHSLLPTFGMTEDPDVMSGFVNRWIPNGNREIGVRHFNMENPDMHQRAKVHETNMPYVAGIFPTAFYLDEATIIEMTDLQTIINPYITEQSAMFISGRRSLDEFDAFQDELRTIGVERLLEIYSAVLEQSR